MDDHDPFGASPEDTHAQMMRATYDALLEHGYADLTIQRIGDEFPKSKSLIYQYYDGKDDLLVALLEFLLDALEEGVPDEEYDDAAEHLRDYLDHALPRSIEGERAALDRALVELRGQAPHDDAYRGHFTRADRFFREHLADVLRRGIDQGVVREVDPERTADFLSTALHGARTRRMTADDVDVDALRAELDEYVRTRLLTDRARETWRE